MSNMSGIHMQLAPRAQDWPEFVHVTGYWTVPPQEGQQLSPKIEAFLEAGSPPVYMGFGSMPVKDPKVGGSLCPWKG